MKFEIEKKYEYFYKIYNTIEIDFSKGHYDKIYNKIKNIEDYLSKFQNYISSRINYDENNYKHDYCISILGMFGGCLIDIGYGQSNNRPLSWGVKIYDTLFNLNGIEKNTHYSHLLYNYANGLSSQLKLKQGMVNKIFFIDDDSIIISEKAKYLYRTVLDLVHNGPKENTNFANMLEQQYGRCIESIDYYDRALIDDPNHAMALANKGKTLYFLSHFNKKNTAITLITEAYFNIKNALKTGMEAYPQNYFLKELKIIEETHPWLKEQKEITCRSKIDNKKSFKSFYLKFCNKHQLFLNPLTKEHKCEAALCDPLLISGFLIDIDDNQFYKYAEYINRLKQEYVFARYLTAQSYYQSQSLKFLDKDVDLVDTLNYTMYGIFTEQARVAYRVAFSVLDKISFVINDYYNIGFSKNHISFELLSFAKHFIKHPDTRISRKLKSLKPVNNPFLAALIDLANDFTGEHLSDIREIRRALEHRFFNLYMLSSDKKLTTEYFREKLIDLLKIIKSGIFYIILMIDWEERKKRTKVDSTKIVNLDTYLIDNKFKMEYF